MASLDHQLELLSPARDADIGIEAINHGADAVYIGGPSFGARSGADNSVQQIARLARHAHRFNSRVFATLNTILRDEELEHARKLAWQLYEAGVDALIIQDMGLLEIDLPPIQLHASTQCDIRTAQKARFLQDAGLSQIVLARELTLQQISEIRQQTHCTLEFFVHGALCVAYSGQCYISQAQSGRSANRGECSQACRLPYQVIDDKGRFVAHDRHVLSMKDNNQGHNLAALVDAGVRSFKIEGRYKDMGYVKNITAHYRKLLDALIEQRQQSAQPLARASSGSTSFSFDPEPGQNFNREFTDYFVRGRQQDIGAFDTPKNPGQPIAHVTQIGPNWVELETIAPDAVLHNGDGLCYYSLQKELLGLAVNRAERSGRHWRVFPKDAMAALQDLRKGTQVNRNRDVDWVRALDRKSAERRIGVWAKLTETPDALQLSLTDEDGHSVSVQAGLPAAGRQLARDADALRSGLREHIGKMGNTIYSLLDLQLDFSQPWFIPTSVLNPLRRDALQALQAVRAQARVRLPRGQPIDPPAAYPHSSLSYLANVYNRKAYAFYARHGVKVIAPAMEAMHESGEVSLMITKHCVRYSLSLCPKQAKGITGVQGSVKAENLQLVNGNERLTLRFDCKACEMHVVGELKNSVLLQTPPPFRKPI
ncbi:MAG: peptidase U32 family protein [Rhodoferax sp.]